MSLKEHYMGALDLGTSIASELFEHNDASVQFAKAHNFISDLEVLRETIEGRPEAYILSLAINEFNFALLALISGKYRHAHISLRLFLELSLASVYFSAYEVKLRRWLAGLEDIHWRTITDIENGLFSSHFISAFTPELEDDRKQFSELAATVYRECSEFVHGNFHTYDKFSAPPQFDYEAFEAWVDRSESVMLAFLYAFACRYLGVSEPEFRVKIEAIMLDNFGHLSGMQYIYSRLNDG